MIEQIQKLIEEVKKAQARNAEEVEQLRIKYLSKRGEVNALMADFRNVPNDMKREIGMRINELKQLAQERINCLRDAVQVAETAGDDLDLTRTPYPVKLGTRHPLTDSRHPDIRSP